MPLHVFNLIAGETVRLTASSADFNPILTILRPDTTTLMTITGEVVLGNNVAVAAFLSPITGHWHAQVTSAMSASGDYTLTIECNVGAPLRSMATDCPINIEAESQIFRLVTLGTDSFISVTTQTDGSLTIDLSTDSLVVLQATASAPVIPHAYTFATNSIIAITSSSGQSVQMALVADAIVSIDATADADATAAESLVVDCGISFTSDAAAVVQIDAQSNSSVLITANGDGLSYVLMACDSYIQFRGPCENFDELLTLEDDSS